MDLDQISQILPNGFHDAQLCKLVLDYERREALIKLDVWIGEASSDSQEDRDAYRAGELCLLGLVYAVLEPPTSEPSAGDEPALWIDGGQYTDGVKVQRPDVTLPEGGFAYWFFVSNWNSFIHVAATDARFRWNDESFDAEKRNQSSGGP